MKIIFVKNVSLMYFAKIIFYRAFSYSCNFLQLNKIFYQKHEIRIIDFKSKVMYYLYLS